jgi:uncharacterized protein YfiM (DUF2279 family)
MTWPFPPFPNPLDRPGNPAKVFLGNTVKKSVFIALTMSMSAAFADEWTGQDKTQHAIGGAAIGAAVTAFSSRWAQGCAAATAIGVAKEVYDSQHRSRHTPSTKDAVVTAVAGCLAAKGTSLIIVPTKNGAMVSYKFVF